MRSIARGRRAAAVSLVAAVAVVAAACGGGDEDSDAEGTDDETAADEEGDEAAAGGEISVFITEPEHLAPPSNVTESNGGEVLNALYAPLVQFDLETSEAIFGDDVPDAVAADIQTEDNQTFTITLKDGWTFHNGDAVTAQSYVDAWNFGAAGLNVNNGATFFSDIAGYDDLQCDPDDPDVTEEEPCPNPPEETEMSGLSVVDDLTFEVTLSEPSVFFPLLLNYTAFHPVPASFFDDPDAFEANPIGNGPFAVDEDGWINDQQVRVERFADYPGTEPNVDAIEYRIYTDIDAGYNDALAGNLDVMDSIPPAQLGSAPDDFANFIDDTSGIIQYIGFPTYDERFSDPLLRQAFNLAVDRQAIAEAVRPDWTPLGGFVPPNVPGALDNECSGNCPATADPERAQELLEQAGGWEGPLTLTFNSGAGHDEWMEAVANQLRDNLGIEEINFDQLQFAEYLPRLEAEESPGPYRLGWIPDYPNPDTYLTSLYESGASSNYTGYASDEFDGLLADAAGADTVADSLPFFEQAQEVMHEDMPGMPMFIARQNGVGTERVTGIQFTFNDALDVFEVAVTE